MNKTARFIVSAIGIGLFSLPISYHLQLAQAVESETSLTLSSESSANTNDPNLGPQEIETSFIVDGTNKRAKVIITKNEVENFGEKQIFTTYRVVVLDSTDLSQTEGGISTQCLSTETCVYRVLGEHNGFGPELKAQLQSIAKAQIEVLEKQKEEAEKARQAQLEKEEYCDYDSDTEAVQLVNCLIKNLKEENGLNSADQRRLRSGLSKLVQERNGERTIRSIVRDVERTRNLSDTNKKAFLTLVNDLTAQKEIIEANKKLENEILPLFQNSQNNPVALQQAYRNLGMFNEKLGQTKYEWLQSAQDLSGNRLNTNEILSSWTDYMPILQGNINLMTMTRPNANGQLDYSGFKNYPEIGFDQDTLKAIDQAQSVIQQSIRERTIGNGRFQRGGANGPIMNQQGVPTNTPYHPGQGGRFGGRSPRGGAQPMMQNNFNNGFQNQPNQFQNFQSFQNFNGNFR